jgi:hypothetical protein
MVQSIALITLKVPSYLLQALLDKCSDIKGEWYFSSTDF